MRKKKNKARKDNHREVVEEDKRKNDTNAESNRAKLEWEEAKKKEREEIMSAGLDPEKEKILSATASEAEWKDRKKRRNNDKTSFGWDRKSFLSFSFLPQKKKLTHAILSFRVQSRSPSQRL